MNIPEENKGESIKTPKINTIPNFKQNFTFENIEKERRNSQRKSIYGSLEDNPNARILRLLKTTNAMNSPTHDKWYWKLLNFFKIKRKNSSSIIPLTKKLSDSMGNKSHFAKQKSKKSSFS